MRRIPAAWRWFVSQGPIFVAFVILSLSVFASGIFQVLDEINEGRHDRDQQARVSSLEAQLQCRVRESSDATRIEGEIAREGWLALTIWARTGESEQPRIAQAAERVEALYRELGPALERRAEAVESCD